MQKQRQEGVFQVCEQLLWQVQWQWHTEAEEEAEAGRGRASGKVLNTLTNPEQAPTRRSHWTLTNTWELLRLFICQHLLPF